MLLGLVVLAVAELAVLVAVAKQIGVLPAVLLLVLISALGPWLVRRAGFSVWRRARQHLDRGEVPGREALDGIILLGAGVLICIPGFITDVIGLLLLLPPVRAGVRRIAEVRFVRRADIAIRGQGPHHPRSGPSVIDASSKRSPR